MPDRTPEDMSEDMPEDMPEHMPEDMSGRMPEDLPDRMPEDMSDRMPEDLPVTKHINAMVGITRSKVSFFVLNVYIFYINDIYICCICIYSPKPEGRVFFMGFNVNMYKPTPFLPSTPGLQPDVGQWSPWRCSNCRTWEIPMEKAGDFSIATGWGPQDSVQLPYKWFNYGLC